MKCYQWTEGWFVEEGIAIDFDPKSGSIPRLKISPVKHVDGNEEFKTYQSTMALPLLHQDIAKRALASVGNDDLLVPEIKLKSCDLEKRADFWALPETEATANQALILATILDGRKRAQLDFVVEGDDAEILSKGEVTRADGRLRGFCVLIRLGPGSIAKRMLQLPERRIFSPNPRSLSTVRLEDDGLNQYFNKKQPGPIRPLPESWLKLLGEASRPKTVFEPFPESGRTRTGESK